MLFKLLCREDTGLSGHSRVDRASFSSLDMICNVAGCYDGAFYGTSLVAKLRFQQFPLDAVNSVPFHLSNSKRVHVCLHLVSKLTNLCLVLLLSLCRRESFNFDLQMNHSDVQSNSRF